MPSRRRCASLLAGLIRVLFSSPPGILAGERGRVMAETLAEVALPWAIAVRTRVYDELILGALEQDQATAVVNLAAGMDARPYRLDLPRSLHWVELDLPRIVDAKNEALAHERAVCELERIGVDLSDRARVGLVLDRGRCERSARAFTRPGGSVESLDWLGCCTGPSR